MKIIKKIFDSQRRHFEAGGRVEGLYPLFESIETIFFGRDTVTETTPHVRDSMDTKRFMTLVIIALLPHLFFGMYNTGYQSHLASGLSLNFFAVMVTGLKAVLPIVVVTYAVGFFWEVLFAVIRKHEVSEGLFVTCMLFPLTLPPTTPLWQVAIGISFGIVIAKEIFGGTGRNFLNPALAGRAFLFFAYPGNMAGDAVWTLIKTAGGTAVDTFSGATPLAISALTQEGSVELTLFDAGYSFFRLGVGTYSGGIGSTSAILALLGAIFLLIVGVASYRIMLGGVAGLLFSGYLFNFLATSDSAPFFSLNPFYHLAMGGFAFGLVYMATEPVTAPDMNISKWIYGFAIGALTVAIRVLNPAFPEGIMLAILFMNLFAPLLDHIEVGIRLKKRVPNV